MKLKMLLGLFFIIISSACSTTTQTAVSDKTVFYGEGKHWNVKYIYDPEMYDEKKVNWVEIEAKGKSLTKEDFDNINIEMKSNDGMISGNIGDMETKAEGNTISFLVGTVNSETYEEDKYKIKINFKDKQDVIKLKRQ